MLWAHWLHVIPAVLAMMVPKSLARKMTGDMMKGRIEQEKKSG
jgi:hypothetical protein